MGETNKNNKFDVFGVMVDVSRNAVLKVETLKKLIDYLSKMGYNAIELYAEDTYKIDGEEMLGYMRGGYTKEDIKEIDAYAKEKGMELIPCIQTLAHYTSPCRLLKYKPIIDINDILLCGDEKTYEFIENIFKTVKECFTSRKINIGMDEAHMVGLGKYLVKNGYQDRFEILCKHVKRVSEICEKYGFTPHMWSDMFFRLAMGGEYLATEKFDKKILDSIPNNMELTYWDYYTDNVEQYDKMINAHKKFEKNLWFAGGCWSWQGVVPENWFSLKTMLPAMQSVSKNGIKNVLITLWGDNGGECSFFSLLPSLYAVKRYADGEYDRATIAKEFNELFGLNFEDFMLLDSPNFTKRYYEEGERENTSKIMLYTDCFMGIFDDHAEACGQIDYAGFAEKLTKAKKNAKDLAYVFDPVIDICKVLDIKFLIGVRTRKAYKANDRKALKGLVKEYKELAKRVEAFYQSFRTAWFIEKRGFGFEIQDARLGGLIMRANSCAKRLEDYLSGKIDFIEELDQEILSLGEPSMASYGYSDCVSLSNI